MLNALQTQEQHADAALLTQHGASCPYGCAAAHQHGLLHVQHGAVELDQVAIVGDGLQQADLLRTCIHSSQKSALSGACDETAPLYPDSRRTAWMSSSTLSTRRNRDVAGIVVKEGTARCSNCLHHFAPFTWIHCLRPVTLCEAGIACCLLLTCAAAGACLFESLALLGVGRGDVENLDGHVLDAATDSLEHAPEAACTDMFQQRCEHRPPVASRLIRLEVPAYAALGHITRVDVLRACVVRSAGLSPCQQSRTSAY